MTIIALMCVCFGTAMGKRLAGTVYGEDGDPVAFADVSFLKPDSTLIGGTLCDSLGRFGMDVTHDSLYVRIMAPGYDDYMAPVPDSANLLSITLSRSSTILQEISIKASTVSHNNDSILLFPTRRQRQYAAGGIGVLKNMIIPQLIIDPVNDDVKTLSGETVSLFIDGQPSTKSDILHIRPRDIQRIELLYSPSDPAFNGATVVLNYVMAQYKTGGYTKFNGMHGLNENKGEYSVYSRLTYKAMTFDMTGSLSNSQSRHDGYSSQSSYKFSDETVQRLASSTAQFTENINPAFSIMARYRKEALSIANTVSINHASIPHSRTEGTVSFSSPLYASGKFLNSTNSKENGVQWKGQYDLSLPRDCRISVSPFLDYLYHKEKNAYIGAGETAIHNDINETAIMGRINVNMSKRINRHTLGAILTYGYNDNKVAYSGSSHSDINQREWYASGGINSRLRFGKITWNLKGMVSYQNTRLNGHKYRDWLPHLYTTLGYAPGHNYSLRVSAEHSIFGNWANVKSPVVIQKNEIDAVEGNPDLKNYRFTGVSLSYAWNPADNLGFSASGRIESYNNPVINQWSQREYPRRSIMVKEFLNNGNFTEYSIGMSSTWSGLEGKLALRVAPRYHVYRQDGMYERQLDNLRLNASAQAYVGKVQLSLSFQKRYSLMTENMTMSIPCHYSADVSWAYRDFFFNIGASNVFNSSYKATCSEIDGGIFHSVSDNQSTVYHRYFHISVAWSFNYGKKVSQNGEINPIEDRGSAILR